jgi:hypothetical protein
VASTVLDEPVVKETDGLRAASEATPSIEAADGAVAAEMMAPAADVAVAAEMSAPGTEPASEPAPSVSEGAPASQETPVQPPTSGRKIRFKFNGGSFLEPGVEETSQPLPPAPAPAAAPPDSIASVDPDRAPQPASSPPEPARVPPPAPACEATSAEPAPRQSAPTMEPALPAAATREALPALPATPSLWKRLYRITDTGLGLINRPFRPLGDGPRGLLGLVAVITTLVCLLVTMLFPLLLPRQDAITFLERARVRALAPKPVPEAHHPAPSSGAVDRHSSQRH